MSFTNEELRVIRRSLLSQTACSDQVLRVLATVGLMVEGATETMLSDEAATMRSILTKIDEHVGGET